MLLITEEEIENALEKSGIKNAKKRKAMRNIMRTHKDKEAQKRAVGYLLPDFLEDPRNNHNQ